MATIQVTYSWPDGSALTVALSAKARYPDGVDDLRGQARRLWHDALAELADIDQAANELEDATREDG